VDASGTTIYAWDFENRLTAVTLPNGGGTVAFKYDPFGRRIQKSYPGGVVNYLYDADNLLGELDATGAVSAKYTQGEGIDEPLATLRNGAIGYYHADALGTITSITDPAGSAVAAYTYDSLGNGVLTAGTTANPFRYTGRELDQETSLYYYRARYYDSSVGRFASEDPIGFEGGANFYAYVSNNPIALTDPSGLGPEDAVKLVPVAGPFVWTAAENAQYLAFVESLQAAATKTGMTVLDKAGAALLVVTYLVSPGLAGNPHEMEELRPKQHPKRKGDRCEQNDTDCTKASPWQLTRAGIADPHEFKRDFLGPKAPISKWDIGACKDGSIVIKARGQCGKPGPSIETGYQWK